MEVGTGFAKKARQTHRYARRLTLSDGQAHALLGGPQAYLLLSQQHPPLPFLLLLPGLGLVAPHAGDIVLIPNVPALLGQDIHGSAADLRWSGPRSNTSDWRENVPAPWPHPCLCIGSGPIITPRPGLC